MDTTQTSKQNSILSIEDVQRLVSDPSYDVKIDITSKIAKHYEIADFNPQQMLMAEEIFRILLKDTEKQVRKTLANHIKKLKNAPKDIIVSLANDVQEVSLPVLQFSEVLNESDLIKIVQTTDNEIKQMAISKRQVVTPPLSDALIETGSNRVVNSLLDNQYAQVDSESYNKIIQNFPNNDSILDSMVQRGSLPIDVVDHLSKTISSSLIDKLKEKHGHIIDEINKNAVKDSATIHTINTNIKDEQLRAFNFLVAKLDIPKDLIPIYALCTGRIELFEYYISKATQIPIINIRRLLNDRSNKGYQALYIRSNLPGNLFETTELLMETLRDIYAQKARVSKNQLNELLEVLMVKSDRRNHVENFDFMTGLLKHFYGSV